jgi:outer membrane protein assembly factor BamA
MEDMSEAGDKKIVFNVSEGIKATVARVYFTGNTHFPTRILRRQMKEVKENNIVTWIRKKNLYIPSKLDEDLEHIKNFYQDSGYMNVAFGEPQLKTSGTTAALTKIRSRSRRTSTSVK